MFYLTAWKYLKQKKQVDETNDLVWCFAGSPALTWPETIAPGVSAPSVLYPSCLQVAPLVNEIAHKSLV